MVVAVKFLALAVDARKPIYGSKGAAGADLHAYCPDTEVTIYQGMTATFRTGISLEIPEGYEGQIRPRSGLAFKHKVTLINAPGTIDSDYSGEIKVCLINHGPEKVIIRHHDRIAQIIFARCERVYFEDAQKLSETERGENGFGSTGR